MFDDTSTTHIQGWSQQSYRGSDSFYQELDFMLSIQTDVLPTQRLNAKPTPKKMKRVPAEQTSIGSVFELLPEGACLVDQNGNITRANSRFLGLISKTAERVIGREFMDLVADCDPLFGFGIDDVFESDLVTRMPLKLKDSTGREVWTTVNARRIHCEDTLQNVGYLITVHES